MSLTTIKPSIEGLSPAFTAHRSINAPAFHFDFRRGLQMHPRTAAVAALLVFAALVFTGLRQPPLYKAQSLIYVQPTFTRAFGESTEANYDSTRYDSYMQQQMQTLMRPDIVGEGLATLPDSMWKRPAESREAAAERVSNALKISRIATSYQLEISLTGQNPASVAAIVNAVTGAYLRQGRRDELAQTDQRTQVLGEERDRLLGELDLSRKEQSSLSASLGTARPGTDNTNPYDVGLTGLRADLAAARETHDLAAAQLASIASAGTLRSAGLTAATDEAIASDPGLGSMKATINERRGQLSGQMAGLTLSNPVYRQDQEQIAQLDRSLEIMTEALRTKAAAHLQDKLRLDLSRTGDLESRINGELARQAAAATSAAPKLQRASDLAADVLRMQTRLASVEDSLRGLQLEINSPGLAHLSLAATVPALPQMSRGRLLIFAALPLALLCGLCAAAVAKKFDRQVFIASDVDEALGFVPLAVLPSSEDVSLGVQEEYLLRLSAGIEHALRISNARTFVITAVSTSIDISALVAAIQVKLNGMGIRTHVIDTAAVLEPQVHTEHQHESSRSGALIKPANTLGVSKRHESYAIANLQRITREYDLLLIEAAPLLISAQTEYVARAADATILIADSGVTLRSDLLQSAALLQRLNAHGVGTVLKDLKLRDADPLYKRSVLALEQRCAQESSRAQGADKVSATQSPDEPLAGTKAPSNVSQEKDPLSRKYASIKAHGAPEIVEAPLPEVAASGTPFELDRLLAAKADGLATTTRWELLSRQDDRKANTEPAGEDKGMAREQLSASR